MRFDLLRLTNLRCFEALEFRPGPALNWLVGDNGAGKTTLLEAAHILSHGRSFRAGGRSAPCRHGAPEYLIHAEIACRNRPRSRLGLARRGDRWRARLDGVELDSLAPLFEACPVVCFGPEGSSLILGPAEERRSFLDWSVFHVEHASLEVWRKWRRALRQRNALLRSDAKDSDFEPWEHDLEVLAVQIHCMRQACLASLEPHFAHMADWLVPELGRMQIDYRPGWDDATGLATQLASQRQGDRERGFTQRGAHRADWLPRFERVARHAHLSRGQAKAVALACALAQASWLNDRSGEYPLLCLDDLDSELDPSHVTKVIAWLAREPLQAWLTATRGPDASRRSPAVCVFHVEHAAVSLAPGASGALPKV